jgi:hypothetical protein
MTTYANEPGTDPQTYTATYAIESLHPHKDAASMAEELKDSLGDLARDLEKDTGYKGVTVSMTLRGTLPVDAKLVYVVIHVVVVAGQVVATGMGRKMGADLFDWIKKRLNNASVKEVPEQKEVANQNEVPEQK